MFAVLSTLPQNMLTPATSIPSINRDDNWMFGNISPPLPKSIVPVIAADYEEMLGNPKRKLISLGLNNSGIIDLNRTVVIDGGPKYIYYDGVEGTLAPLHRKSKKLPLTDQYDEMLKDTSKKIISLGVNNSAFYDPENQIIVQGTEETNTLDVLGQTMKDIEEENKRTMKKEKAFIENNSPRFLEKNDEKMVLTY